MSGTEIRLCGGLALEVDGRRLEDSLPSRQGRLLFAYLVLHRDRSVTRDQLVEALWPDRPPADPGGSLNPLVSKLRRALGSDVLRGRHELRLHLSLGAWIDVEAAEEALARAQAAIARGDRRSALAPAESALGMLADELLPGVDLPWVDERRRELGESRLIALECVAAGALAQGSSKVAAAEEAARALIAAAPFRESGYRFLMEVHERRGNVADGLLVFELLRTLLRDELGAVPGRASRRVHGRLLAQGDPAAHAFLGEKPSNEATRVVGRAGLPLPGMLVRASSRPFVGRAEALRRLREELRGASAGARRFMGLAGEPGIGKTVLAAQLAREAHSAGVAVLYGRSDEDGLLPYQPFVEMLCHYVEGTAAEELEQGPVLDLSELARIVPPLGRFASEEPDPVLADPGRLRLRLFDSVVALLRRAAGGGPLLLVLDDLHWADTPTLLLLRHLMRSPEIERLLVLGTFRDTEIAPGQPLADRLTELRREGLLVRIALSGLDEDETLAMLGTVGGGEVSTGFARRLRQLTAGNPFFIEEAMRRLADAASSKDGTGALSEAALGRLGVPEGAREVIEQRLSRLDAATRETLTLAAVVGDRFRAGTLEAALAPRSVGVVATLEQGVARGLLRESREEADTFSFAHALVRDALYGSMTASGRARLHRRVGEALEASGTARPPAIEELAHHFFEARHVAGPERAIRYAQDAADRATASAAYETAARHLERALEADALRSAPDRTQRCELLIALGEAQLRSGDGRARRSFEHAAALAREADDAERLGRAAIGFGGRYYEAGVVDDVLVDLLEESLAILPQRDSALRSRLLARLGEVLHFAGEPERAGALSASAIQMARRLEDPEALAGALAGRHVTLLHVEHLDERLRVSESLVALARTSAHRELEAQARHARLYDLHELGDIAGARSERSRLADLADELGQPLYRHFALSWTGVRAQLGGQFDEAERLAGELFDLQIRLGARDAQSVFAARLFNIRRDQGRLGELVPAVETFVEQFPALAPWRAALPLVLAEAGEEERARAELERLGNDGFRAIPRNFFWLTAIGALADATALVEHEEHSAVLYELLAPYAERQVQVGFAACLGPVARHLGLLAGVLGWRERALADLERAAARAEAFEAPTLVARVACDRVETLARLGDSGEATASIEEALGQARALGMEGLVGRLERSRASLLR